MLVVLPLIPMSVRPDAAALFVLRAAAGPAMLLGEDNIHTVLGVSYTYYYVAEFQVSSYVKQMDDSGLTAQCSC